MKRDSDEGLYLRRGSSVKRVSQRGNISEREHSDEGYVEGSSSQKEEHSEFGY